MIWQKNHVVGDDKLKEIKKKHGNTLNEHKNQLESIKNQESPWLNMKTNKKSLKNITLSMMVRSK